MPDFTNLIIWEGLAFLLVLPGIVVVWIMTGDCGREGLLKGPPHAGRGS